MFWAGFDMLKAANGRADDMSDFLKTWLENPKEAIWSQIAEDIGGNYEHGGLWKNDVLRYRTGNWEITLDTYTISTGQSMTTFTRMRAPFVSQTGFRFTVYPEGFLAAIGKFFGLQDLEIGDAFFDKRYLVKSNDPALVRRLLSDAELKPLIQSQPDICFEIRDDGGWFAERFPEGVDALSFQCYGILTDKQLLRNLFQLFSLTLQRLVEIGAAQAEAPELRL